MKIINMIPNNSNKKQVKLYFRDEEDFIDLKEVIGFALVKEEGPRGVLETVEPLYFSEYEIICPSMDASNLYMWELI